MSNSYYNHTTYPGPYAPGSSAAMRAELQKISVGFDRLPNLSGGAAGQVVLVNPSGNGLITSFNLANLVVTSSTINGTPIGQATPAAGSFTTLSASGAVVLGSNVQITGGSINGAPIGGTTRAAGAFTTLSANSGITGNLIGNVQGNVTGGVMGNVTGNLTGNVNAASGTSQFNNVKIAGQLDMDAGTTATIINLSTPANSGDAATKGYVDGRDALKLDLAGGTMSGPIAMGNSKVTGLADPENPQDAANKRYVDSAVQGLDAKDSCRTATTANISLSGTQTVGGVALSAGNRVLVKNQTNAAQNGIYIVASGAWTRAEDANAWNELVHAFTFVEDGSAANNGYVCTVQAGGTLGTTPVTWQQFSGAGQIEAGAGMTKTGNRLDVGTASSDRIVVNADNIDLAASGVTPSTYRSVVVDIYGRVTGGSNPTTLAGYGISDAYTKTEADGLLDQKLNLTGGNLTGSLGLGGNKVTNVADPTDAQDAASKGYVDTILGSATSAEESAYEAAVSEIEAGQYAAQAQASALDSQGFSQTAETAAAAAQAAAGLPAIAGKAGAALTVKEDGTGVEWRAAKAAPTLDGPISATVSTTVQYTITNYNSFATYAVSVSAGTVAIAGNEITFNAPATVQSVTLTVTMNGLPSAFTVEVEPAPSYIPTPAATPANFGDAFEGGFYAGLFWDQIAQSSSSKTLATGTQSFTVPDMASAPIVYEGQLLEVRSRANPANKFIGTVTNAAGTTLKLNVTSVEGTGTFSDWSIMSRFRNIVAPKASGENAGIALKDANTAFPSGCQSLVNGWAATEAMRLAGNSTEYPAAHWARGLNIGGKTDWYIPARDELELAWRNLKPTTTANYTSADRPTGQAFDYKRDGAYGDTANTHGTNNNSSPTGAAYTSSVPGQTAAAAFQTGGAEAYEFGSAYYWTSTEYNATNAWFQYWGTSIAGNQLNVAKSSARRVRAVRRSII